MPPAVQELVRGRVDSGSVDLHSKDSLSGKSFNVSRNQLILKGQCLPGEESPTSQSIRCLHCTVVFCSHLHQTEDDGLPQSVDEVLTVGKNEGVGWGN